MGVLVDSCKSTIKCCDSDDEREYKKTFSENLTSNSDQNDQSVKESEQQDKNNRVPKEVKNMKISVNNIFMQRYISPWKF